MSDGIRLVMLHTTVNGPAITCKVCAANVFAYFRRENDESHYFRCVYCRALYTVPMDDIIALNFGENRDAPSKEPLPAVLQEFEKEFGHDD